MQARDSLLRRALRGNALFSALSGLTLLVAAGPLAPVLGVPGLALRVVGAVLLPFAVGLWLNARRATVVRAEAWLAVALDLAWVGGSVALIGAELWPLETAGVVAVIAVAAVVLGFAGLQALGLVRAAARRGLAEGPA